MSSPPIKITPPPTPYVDHWNGTTQYQDLSLRRFTLSGVTNSSGQVTFNLTTDGTATGPALFSSIFAIQAIGVYTGATSTSVPNPYVQNIAGTLKTVTIGITTGTAISILGVLSIVFGGSGYTIYVTVEGQKA